MTVFPNLARIPDLLPASAKHVLRLLEERGLDHWIDSGTLLGIVRDGRLLPNDRDIDLSVAVEDDAMIEELVRDLRKFDHAMNIRTWHGKIFKVKVYPKLELGEEMEVDLNFFRRVGDERLCPSIRQRVVRGNGLKKRLGPGWKRFVKNFFERTQYRLDVSGRISDLWLYKETWWFPEQLVAPTYLTAEGPFRVPSRIDEYLTFRYGDWRTPRSDWDFSIHDGGFRRERVARLD